MATSVPTAARAAPTAFRPPLRLWQVAVAAAAVPLGVAAAFRPAYAVAAMVALVLLPVEIGRAHV